MLLSFIKTHRNLLLILLFALSLRLWQVNDFPVSFANDDFDYVINAKSLYYTGQFIPLHAAGLLSLGVTNVDKVIGELPSIFMAPIVGPLPISQFAGRLPFVILSLFTILFIYLVVKKLTDNQNLALLTAAVMAFNPWSFHFARISYDHSFSTFFYLVGIYVILKSEKWRVLLSLPFFIAGFFSYHGAKISFFPIILFLSSWKYFIHKENKKYVLVLIGIALICLVGYGIAFKYQATSNRSNEVLFLSPELANKVNADRQASIPSPIAPVFLNKVTYSVTYIMDIYLKVFSIDYLFSNGEILGSYSFKIHGMFYRIDLLFMVIGILTLYRKYKKALLFTAGILLIAPIASAVSLSGESYVGRAGIIFPFLAFLIGAGIWGILNYFNKKFTFLKWGIVLIYAISIINFIYIYFYRYPVYASDAWFYSDKVLARYLQLVRSQNPDIPITVSHTEPRYMFEKYLYYNGLYNNKENIVEFNNKIEQNDFSVDSIKFQRDCLKEWDGKSLWVYHSPHECVEDGGKNRRIASPYDAGAQMIIKGDILCNDIGLSKFPRITTASDFDVYSLNREKFCDIWISSLEIPDKQ